MQKTVQKRSIERKERAKTFRKWFWRSTMLAGLGIFSASFYVSLSDYKGSIRNEFAQHSRMTGEKKESLQHQTLFAGAIGAIIAGFGSTMMERKKNESPEAGS